jgi:hypothetical protein
MATCCGEAQLIHIGCNSGLVGDTLIVYTKTAFSPVWAMRQVAYGSFPFWQDVHSSPAGATWPTRYSVSRYTIYGQIYSIVLSTEAFAVSSVIHRYIRTDVCILYCLCAPHG